MSGSTIAHQLPARITRSLRCMFRANTGRWSAIISAVTPSGRLYTAE